MPKRDYKINLKGNIHHSYGRNSLSGSRGKMDEANTLLALEVKWL